jgi:tetratricopeptide (TPR) repeat protein
MTRLDNLLANKWPPDDLSKLSTDLTTGKLSDQADRSVLRAAVNALRKANLTAEAQACSRALADLSQDERDLISLASSAMSDKDWNLAEQVCARAIEKDRSRAAPRYLRGHCLTKLGREKEGREMIDLALLLPLADDADRYDLANHLQQAGLTDAAATQFQLLTRIGDFSGWEVGNASRILAQRASQQGDDLASAALWERSILPCLHDHTGFVDVAAYLGVPHLIHHTRARGLLKTGQPDAALNEIKLCEEYLPGDISLPIELAAPLREAHREKDLLDLVNRTLQRQQEILASYPNAAMIHNSAAWLLARCRLNLDTALKHAQQAAKLEPQSAAILDTLAETHFQLGQKEKAIEVIQTCIKLEPTVNRHQLQLTRFQTQSPNTPPPPDSR